MAVMMLMLINFNNDMHILAVFVWASLFFVLYKAPKPAYG